MRITTFNFPHEFHKILSMRNALSFSVPVGTKLQVLWRKANIPVDLEDDPVVLI